MSKPDENEFKNLLAAAETAVAAIPSPGPGIAFGAPLAAAQAAVGELAKRSRSFLWTDCVPLGQDVVADLEYYSQAKVTALDFPVMLGALHARALLTHPALASALRGPVILARVAAAGRAAAAVRAISDAEAEAHAVTLYEGLVVGALVAAGQGSPWAPALAAALTLEAQLAARKAEHQAAAATELERIRAEESAAAVVLQREADEREAAAAAEVERLEIAAKAARSAAEKERGERLARRVERHGRDLRVGSSLYAAADLALGLRRGVESRFALDVQAALAEVGA